MRNCRPSFSCQKFGCIIPGTVRAMELTEAFFQQCTERTTATGRRSACPIFPSGVRVISDDFKLLYREECTTQSSDRCILRSLIFEERAGRHDD